MNTRATRPSDLLEPLRASLTGDEIPDFPVYVGDIGDMEGKTATPSLSPPHLISRYDKKEDG